MKQVLDAIAAETGVEMGVKKAPRRLGDPPVLVADSTKASQDLNFEPKLSDLKTVVATAWRWHRHAHPRVGDDLKIGSRLANVRKKRSEPAQ